MFYCSVLFPKPILPFQVFSLSLSQDSSLFLPLSLSLSLSRTSSFAFVLLCAVVANRRIRAITLTRQQRCTVEAQINHGSSNLHFHAVPTLRFPNPNSAPPRRLQFRRRCALHAQTEPVGPGQRPSELGSHARESLYLVPRHLQPGQPSHSSVFSLYPSLFCLFLRC